MLGRGGWLCRRRDSDDPNARENWREESVHLSQDSVADEWVLGDVDIGSVEATDARPRRRLRW